MPAKKSTTRKTSKPAPDDDAPPSTRGAAGTAARRGQTTKSERAAPVAPGGGISEYHRKRDPGGTPEPFGDDRTGTARRERRVPLQFVVHKHDATNLHYDLRLELEGTYKSWAVPKGPSTRAEEKRLAVHVEDHPIEYGKFEGVIPEGNYGAGSVIIWDRGWYRTFKPEPLEEQYARKKMELEFFGWKLRGRWTLVRMGKLPKEWLLLKKAGAGVSDVELIDRYPQSVVCGLTVEEMADVDSKVEAVREEVAALGAPKRAVPAATLKPMLATLEENPFDRDGWIFEIKYDGVRVIAQRRDSKVALYSRNGNDVTRRYPEIVEALLALPNDDFVIDGEIIATDESGQPSFQRLQRRMHLSDAREVARLAAECPVSAVFFDAVAMFGYDLRGKTLVERKECLRLIVPPLGTARYGDHIERYGTRFYEAAESMQLEGIMAKRGSSTYSSVRSKDWIKIKCQRRQEFVIGGWTDPHGGRAGFGALDVGVYVPAEKEGAAPKLAYVCGVGTGFGHKAIDDILAQLKPLVRDESPFEIRSPKPRGHHWVEPQLVCEVRFTEWTNDGGLRHPAFLGLREDKDPREVVREDPVRGADEVRADGGDDEVMEEVAEEVEKSRAPSKPRANSNGRSARASRGADSGGDTKAERPHVPVSNLNKVFWPKDGYTKGDLINYYETIAPHMLHYLRDRPIFITRYPDGIEGKNFYQKDAPEWTPAWMRVHVVEHDEDSNRYFVLDDVESLRYIANMGTIPIHAWSSRATNLECPDYCIIDLDPKEAPFSDVIAVAHTVRDLLEELKLPSYVKTSGASGLHVLLPLGAQYDYEQSRTFARVLATIVVQRQPKISTIIRPVRARAGKVYVDFGQNGFGQSIVAPFSVRARPGATVSTPIDWDEVNAKLDPAKFTIKNVPERFAKRKEPMLPVLGPGIDMGVALERIAKLKG